MVGEHLHPDMKYPYSPPAKIEPNTIVEFAHFFARVQRARRSTNNCLNMENKNEITFGPIFTAELMTHPVSGLLAPLNLVMEWSNSNKATKLPLFRRVIPYAPNQIRLEHIIFRHSDLHRSIDCHGNQVVEAAGETFLSLEALLVALHGSYEISRSIFGILNDLAAVVPLHSKITNPIAAKGLLKTDAEMQGFRLNAVFWEPGLTYAHIGWAPECLTSRLHVSLASFHRGSDGAVDEGKWMAQHEIGISQVLANELHRLAPGNPTDLLTPAGMEFLNTNSHRWSEENDSRVQNRAERKRE